MSHLTDASLTGKDVQQYVFRYVNEQVNVAANYCKN